jgi:hypothetical protein
MTFPKIKLWTVPKWAADQTAVITVKIATDEAEDAIVTALEAADVAEQDIIDAMDPGVEKDAAQDALDAQILITTAARAAHTAHVAKTEAYKAVVLAEITKILVTVNALAAGEKIVGTQLIKSTLKTICDNLETLTQPAE